MWDSGMVWVKKMWIAIIKFLNEMKWSIELSGTQCLNLLHAECRFYCYIYFAWGFEGNSWADLELSSCAILDLASKSLIWFTFACGTIRVDLLTPKFRLCMRSAHALFVIRSVQLLLCRQIACVVVVSVMVARCHSTKLPLSYKRHSSFSLCLLGMR